MNNINPPFAIGQKIVCVEAIDHYSADDMFRIKEGVVYTVSKIEKHKYRSEYWAIGLSEAPAGDRYAHIQFAPIGELYADMTSSIAQSAKQTDEVPDKVLIPETINN